MLRETTSRDLCGLVCPSHTSERRGEGDCVKEGGGEEGDRERERAVKVRLCYSLGYCVCVYYCSTYYKAVHVCLFTAGPITKLLAWGGGGSCSRVGGGDNGG